MLRFFPAAGYRNWQSGAPVGRNSEGLYWFSSASTITSGWALHFDKVTARPESYTRTFGFSVRCVAQWG